jgi:hypothetical protein
MVLKATYDAKKRYMFSAQFAKTHLQIQKQLLTLFVSDPFPFRTQIAVHAG